MTYPSIAYALGAKRSHPAKLARRVSLEHHPLVRARLEAHRSGVSPLPSSFDLAQWCPAILDQGQSGSCTAHSSAAAIATALAAKKLSIVLPSPRLTYALTRSRERAAATPPGQKLPALTDSGAELADVFAVFGEYGVAPMQGPTPDGRNSDEWTDADTGGTPPGVVNAEAVFGAAEIAAQRLIVGPYGTNPAASNASDVLAAAIVTGVPIVSAFFCDSAFQALRPGQVAPAPNQNDPSGGGHAVMLQGYAPASPSGSDRTFTLRNSWGSSWCAAGTTLVGPAWLEASWEAWPVDVDLLTSGAS